MGSEVYPPSAVFEAKKNKTLTPYTLGLTPESSCAAVTRDEGDSGTIGTDGRFPTTSAGSLRFQEIVSLKKSVQKSYSDSSYETSLLVR